MASARPPPMPGLPPRVWRKRRSPLRARRTHAPTRRGRGPRCRFRDAPGGAGVPARGGQASGTLSVYTGRFKQGVSAALTSFPLPARDQTENQNGSLGLPASLSLGDSRTSPAPSADSRPPPPASQCRGIRTGARGPRTHQENISV